MSPKSGHVICDDYVTEWQPRTQHGGHFKTNPDINRVWSSIISYDSFVSVYCRFYPKKLLHSVVFDVLNSMK